MKISSDYGILILFSRVVYFTNGLSFFHFIISRMVAVDINLILVKYFEILFFTNLVCTKSAVQLHVVAGKMGALKYSLM